MYAENCTISSVYDVQMQQKLVDEFCKHHNLSHHAFQLPRAKENAASSLYRHLLLNDKTGTLFCFVPKVGCTNLKLLFFVAIGVFNKFMCTYRHITYIYQNFI